MMKTTFTIPIDRMFRAFSDRTRLRILNLLLRGELCVCDIVKVLRVPQPAASRHLAYLRRSELVETRREGLWMYYRLAKPQTASHQKMLDCLACCGKEIPQLAKDTKQVTRSACC